MNPDGPLIGDDPADLAAGFHRVADRLEALGKYGRRSRELIVGVIIAGLLIAGLAAWGAVLTLQYSSQAAQIKANQAAITADVAARRDEAVAEEAKLCASFSKLAALKPPPAGAGAQNLSRTYLDRQHVIFAGIGSEIGCKRS